VLGVCVGVGVEYVCLVVSVNENIWCVFVCFCICACECVFHNVCVFVRDGVCVVMCLSVRVWSCVL